MKCKMQQASVGDNQVSGNEQVRREIQSFLQALDSYPDRVAKNPGITFEEHCSGFVRTARTEPQRRV